MWRKSSCLLNWIWKKLFSLKGETVSFSAIPLGGYVRMLEVNDRSKMDNIEDCFETKSLLARSFNCCGPNRQFYFSILCLLDYFYKRCGRAYSVCGRYFSRFCGL